MNKGKMLWAGMTLYGVYNDRPSWIEGFMLKLGFLRHHWVCVYGIYYMLWLI